VDGRAATRPQAGQIAILLALGATAFFGFLGLALDGGTAYLEHRKLQHAAEMSALAAAWTFFNHNYAGPTNLDYNPVLSGVNAARAQAALVAHANGFPQALTPTVAFVDAGGNNLDVSGCPAAPCPGLPGVRGVAVTLSRAQSYQVLGVLGVSSSTLGARATAMIRPLSAAVGEAPLLLQNYSSSSANVTRGNAYPICAKNPGDGVQYPASPDCRPRVEVPKSPTPPVVVLAPAYEILPPVPPGIRFYVMHDPPTSSTQSAVRATTANGLSSLLNTCLVPSCTDSYWVDLSQPIAPADDGVFNGVSDRIAAAPANQDCSLPAGDATRVPLTAGNPRIMRLPISYGAVPSPLPPPLPGTSAQLKVSETLLFCASSVGGIAANYVISGYVINEPTNSPVQVPSMGAYAASPYFGQDINVSLSQ
jgi:hypothetical protein